MESFDTVMPTVGVIGLGQIGGSIARAQISASISVCGWDTDEETRESAKAAGVEVLIEADVVAQSDTVFVCVPLRLNKFILERILGLPDHLRAGKTITDVASYKSGTFPAQDDGCLILGHPMAGEHGFGFASANLNLFRDKIWILIVSDKSDPIKTADLTILLTQMGARVRLCDIPWHDQTVSLVSATPHALAVVLGNVVGRQYNGILMEQFGAGSFGSATRVLKSSNELICDLLRFNRPTLLPLLEQSREVLASLGDLLRRGEGNDLSEFVKMSQDMIAANQRNSYMSNTEDVPQSRLMLFFLGLVNRGTEIVRVSKLAKVYQFDLRLIEES